MPEITPKKTEIKIIVEYILDAPANLIITKVDDFVQDTLEEGKGADTVKSCRVTGIEYAGRLGIVDLANKATSALDLVEALTDPESLYSLEGDELTVDNIKDILTQINSVASKALNEIEDEPEN